MSKAQNPSHPFFPHDHPSHVLTPECPDCLKAGFFPKELPKRVFHKPTPRVSQAEASASSSPDDAPSSPSSGGRDPSVDPSPSPEAKSRNTRAVPALLPLVEGVASAASDVATYAGAAYVTYEGVSSLYGTLRKAYNSFVSAAVPLGYTPRDEVLFLTSFPWLSVENLSDLLVGCLTSDLSCPSALESYRVRYAAMFSRTPPFSDSHRFPELRFYVVPVFDPFLSLFPKFSEFLCFRWRDADPSLVTDFLETVRQLYRLLDPSVTANREHLFDQEGFERSFSLTWVETSSSSA